MLSLPFESGLGGVIFLSLRHNHVVHSLRSGVAAHTPSSHALGLRSLLVFELNY